MEFVVIPSQDRIQWTELQQPWRRDPVSHTPTEPGLVFPILVLEDGADQNQVCVCRAQNPLPVVSNIHMRDWRSEAWERCHATPLVIFFIFAQYFFCAFQVYCVQYSNV